MMRLKPRVERRKVYRCWPSPLLVVERLDLLTGTVDRTIPFHAPRQPHLIAQQTEG